MRCLASPFPRSAREGVRCPPLHRHRRLRRSPRSCSSACTTPVTRPVQAATLRGVLSETVLRRPAGGHDVMVRQLTRMVEMSERRTYTFGLCPFMPGPSRGTHRSVRHPAVSGDGDWRGVRTSCRLCRWLHRGSVPGQTKEVTRYDGAFAGIWRTALKETSSRGLLSHAVGSYASHDGRWRKPSYSNGQSVCVEVAERCLRCCPCPGQQGAGPWPCGRSGRTPGRRSSLPWRPVNGV